MNIEKIEINGHYVWVDKDAEISGFENDIWVYRDERVWLWQNNMALISNNKPVKIIAASPELNLELVPTYVEWLAEQNPEGYIQTDYQKIFVEGFVQGYQTAEKELPTWDDVRKATELAQETILTDLRFENREPKYTTEEIIEQLKQSKQ